MYSNYGTDKSDDKDGEYYGPSEVYDPVLMGPTPIPDHSHINKIKFQDFEGIPPSRPPPSPSQLNRRHITPGLNPIQPHPDRGQQLDNRASAKYMSPLELQASGLILGQPLEAQHIYGNDSDPKVQKRLCPGQSNSKVEGLELQNIGEKNKSQASLLPNAPKASGCTLKTKVCLIIVGIVLALF